MTIQRLRSGRLQVRLRNTFATAALAASLVTAGCGGDQSRNRSGDASGSTSGGPSAASRDASGALTGTGGSAGTRASGSAASGTQGSDGAVTAAVVPAQAGLRQPEPKLIPGQQAALPPPAAQAEHGLVPEPGPAVVRLARRFLRRPLPVSSRQESCSAAQWTCGGSVRWRRSG